MAAIRTRALGIECTDLPPGVEELRIEPNKASEFGVHVTLRLAGQAHPMSFGVREFTDLAQTLDGMVVHAHNMAAAYKGEDEILP